MESNTLGHHSDAAVTLGNVLKTRRETERLSQHQVATELGISRTYLSRLERGEYAHPSISILAQMAERFAIPIENLYALVGYIRPTQLPDVGPYLRAKHPDWPEFVRSELAEFYDFLKHKYSLN